MHATIRRYKMKGPVAEAGKLVHEHLIPVLASIDTFIAYYAIDAGDGTAVSVSVYEDETGTKQSNHEAARVVGAKLNHLVDGPPEIIAGEVFAAES